MQNQINTNQTDGTNNTQPQMQNQVQSELLNQDIFKVLKLENLTEDKKEEMKKKMSDTIFARIIARIMDKLSKEDQQKFQQLIDAGNNEETTKFLDEKVKLQDIVIQEVLLYKAEMIDNAQKIDEMVKSE